MLRECRGALGYVTGNTTVNSSYPPKQKNLGEETTHNKSRMSWAGNTARNGEEINAYNILVWEPVRKEIAWKTQTYMGRIILKLILKKHDAGAWTGLIWFTIGNNGSFCGQCNESLCSTEDGKSNDQLSNSWHLKKDSSLWISFNSYEQSVQKNVCA